MTLNNASTRDICSVRSFSNSPIRLIKFSICRVLCGLRSPWGTSASLRRDMIMYCSRTCVRTLLLVLNIKLASLALPQEPRFGPPTLYDHSLTISIHIVHAGQLVTSASFGYAARQPRIPARPLPTADRCIAAQLRASCRQPMLCATLRLSATNRHACIRFGGRSPFTGCHCRHQPFTCEGDAIDR